ncbi:MAG: NUDIX domain-containing protein [Fibrobacter sp.]|nr:NUDIX domain-containing protein [Fibrobacter sp.]
MFAVSGIVVREGRVLLCRRNQTGYYGGAWEFPVFEVEEGETAEDSLERNLFDCLSVQLKGAENYGALDMGERSFVRIFLYGAEIEGKIKAEGAYNRYKWLKIKELKKFRLSRACVTAIKGLENLCP